MDKIVIVDFGSQYSHLIARRIRQLGVYSEIRHPNSDFADAKGIILSGGPSSVYEKNSPKIDKKVLCLGIPVLGICYGHQLISYLFGGKLEGGSSREYGLAKLKIGSTSLFDGLEDEEVVWMSHGDHVKILPQGFRSVGRTESCVNAAVCDEEKKLFGLQFHPEVTHTRNGMRILDNFLKICRARRSWNVDAYLEQMKRDVEAVVGGKNIFLLISGGVDSTVAFVLLKEILGKDRVLGLHVDNGFMRLKESSHVMTEMKNLGLNVRGIDASQEFLSKLCKITDPEEKRKIIGKTFILVTDEALKNLGLDKEGWILGQGTIYPDTIESGGTNNSAKIKTHHNRVDVVKRLISEGRIVEPLKGLYKDEVRSLGRKLGIPARLISRHPFPGPGLAIRCLCQEKPQRAYAKVSIAVEKIVKPYLLEFKILPVKSVGVQGDSRSYKNPVMLAGEAEWGTLDKVATEVCNKVRGVNRVVWHVAGEKELKPKKSYLTSKRLDLLRKLDFLVRKFVWDNDYHSGIWQMPVVLLPLGIDGKESVVLRPVCSSEAMTVSFARMKMDDVKLLAEKLLNSGKVSAVLYDITNKPPGTVEWE